MNFINKCWFYFFKKNKKIECVTNNKKICSIDKTSLSIKIIYGINIQITETFAEKYLNNSELELLLDIFNDINDLLKESNELFEYYDNQTTKNLKISKKIVIYSFLFNLKIFIQFLNEIELNLIEIGQLMKHNKNINNFINMDFDFYENLFNMSLKNEINFDFSELKIKINRMVEVFKKYNNKIEEI
jgi:hypothetical protein